MTDFSPEQLQRLKSFIDLGEAFAMPIYLVGCGDPFAVLCLFHPELPGGEFFFSAQQEGMFASYLDPLIGLTLLGVEVLVLRNQGYKETDEEYAREDSSVWSGAKWYPIDPERIDQDSLVRPITQDFFIRLHDEFCDEPPDLKEISRRQEAYKEKAESSVRSGFVGRSGFSGYSGSSGFSGYSGISGFSGYISPNGVGFSGYSELSPKPPQKRNWKTLFTKRKGQ